MLPTSSQTMLPCPTGLDSADLVSQLRAAHAADDAQQSGVDVIAGRVGSMQELGIFEAYKVCSGPMAVS
jgi:chaperonin GroEL (HSP60 family)